MIRIALTAAFIALGATAQAQQGNPVGHFVENWDSDGDGKVTLAEATERRGDIFVTFDENEDGVLSATEYDAFDDARASDMEAMREDQTTQAAGQGMGMGRDNPANGMLRRFTDQNGDGQVTHDEFMATVPGWFQRMDGNGDGAVSAEDFGPRGG